MKTIQFIIFCFFANQLSGQKINLQVGDSVTFSFNSIQERCNQISAYNFGINGILLKENCKDNYLPDTLTNIFKLGSTYIAYNKSVYYLVNYNYSKIKITKKFWDSDDILLKAINAKKDLAYVYEGGFFEKVIDRKNIQFKSIQYCCDYESENLNNNSFNFSIPIENFSADSILYFPPGSSDVCVFEKSHKLYVYSMDKKSIIDSNIVIYKEVDLYNIVIITTNNYLTYRSFEDGNWVKVNIPNIIKIELLADESPDIIYAVIHDSYNQNYKLDLFTGKFHRLY